MNETQPLPTDAVVAKPKVVLELPDGDPRIARVCWAEMQGDTLHLCISVDALVDEEPVFAFRRKGLDDFCTCTEKRYAELSLKPNLFETRIFYTEPPVLAMGRVPQSEALRLFDAGWKAAALFCGREDVVADGIIGFGACPQFEAAFAAAQGIKQGGQHGAE